MYKVEISPKTIIYTIGSLLALYFIWIIKDLLFSLFIAFILMSALRPPVLWLHRKKIPRTIAALTVYIVFIFFFIFLVSLIIPPIVSEITNLIANLPSIIKHTDPRVYGWFKVDSLSQYIPTVTSNVVDVFTNVASNTFFVISTLFFGFYFLLQENILKNVLSRFIDDKRTNEIEKVVNKIEKRMSSWFWGELTLMIVVGALTFIGLSIIGMKYTLAFAVLAGLLEVVPNVGPIISAIPPILIALTYSSPLAGAVLAVYVIVQQLENNFIVPIIMKNAVGLNPIVTLIALVVGGRIGGTLGLLLAIPAYLFIEVVIIEYVIKKKTLESAR